MHVMDLWLGSFVLVVEIWWVGRGWTLLVRYGLRGYN